MSDDVEQGAKVDAHAGAVRAGEVGHGSGTLRVDGWMPSATAPEGVVVQTKIDDEQGVRNEQLLKRRGRLWFFSDGSMYVYYTPTHWKPV